MHIGLIGGIGPAATDFYYRRLIATFAARQASLELTIVHADTPTLLRNLTSNDQEAQVAIYSRLTKRLVSASADCVVVTSIAGHFCIKAFEAESPLPVVNLLTEVTRAVESRGLKRLGILGTRTVMETRFYGGITSATVLPPAGSELDDVHNAYSSMATAGTVTQAQRRIFDTACERLIQEQGAEAIMLGGTDLALAFKEETSEFPLVDCAGIHVDAIAKLARPQNRKREAARRPPPSVSNRPRPLSLRRTVLHHLGNRRVELRHLLISPHRHANVLRPFRPPVPRQHNFLRRHRRPNLCPGEALH